MAGKGSSNKSEVAQLEGIGEASQITFFFMEKYLVAIMHNPGSVELSVGMCGIHIRLECGTAFRTWTYPYQFLFDVIRRYIVLLDSSIREQHRAGSYLSIRDPSFCFIEKRNVIESFFNFTGVTNGGTTPASRAKQFALRNPWPLISMKIVMCGKDEPSNTAEPHSGRQRRSIKHLGSQLDGIPREESEQKLDLFVDKEQASRKTREIVCYKSKRVTILSLEFRALFQLIIVTGKDTRSLDLRRKKS
ncbi:hypothetical protein V1477_017626 [Vespula maculifrons]|uniref:Uncharacterized protein n=1 Tax=Vespula maculifrons TaxID=7453 RepID=A0ABD2B6L3_VESMC